MSDSIRGLGGMVNNSNVNSNNHTMNITNNQFISS